MMRGWPTRYGPVAALLVALVCNQVLADEIAMVNRLRTPNGDAVFVTNAARGLRRCRNNVDQILLTLAGKPWSTVGTQEDAKTQAILLLGEGRIDAEPAITALLGQLVYGITPDHLESKTAADRFVLYPAARSLVRIGGPAVPLVLLHFWQTTRDDLEYVLAARILWEILGEEGARDAIDRRFTTKPDARAKRIGGKLLEALNEGKAQEWRNTPAPGPNPDPDAAARVAAAEASNGKGWLDTTESGRVMTDFFKNQLPGLMQDRDFAAIHAWLTAHGETWRDSPVEEQCRKLLQVAEMGMTGKDRNTPVEEAP